MKKFNRRSWDNYCALRSERMTPEHVRARREQKIKEYLDEKFLDLYVSPAIGREVPWYFIGHISRPFWLGVVKPGINDVLKDMKAKIYKDVLVGKDRVRFKVVGYGRSDLTSKRS